MELFPDDLPEWERELMDHEFQSDEAHRPEAFGEELRQRRFELGITQQELGDAAGCHRATIRSVETGKPVTQATMYRIRRALHEVAERKLATYAEGAARGRVPTAHGLHYVTRDGTRTFCLTDNRGTPELPAVEQSVLIALLRYALNEYVGGESMPPLT